MALLFRLAILISLCLGVLPQLMNDLRQIKEAAHSTNIAKLPQQQKATTTTSTSLRGNNFHGNALHHHIKEDNIQRKDVSPLNGPLPSKQQQPAVNSIIHQQQPLPNHPPPDDEQNNKRLQPKPNHQDLSENRNAPVLHLRQQFKKQSPSREKKPCQTLASWPVTYDDQLSTSDRMLNWLSFFQNRCVNQSLSWNFNGESSGGYGSYVVLAFQGLSEALEGNNRIYYPRARFIWSYNDTSRCTRGVAGADCFSQAYTFCSPTHPPLTDFPSFINVFDAVNLHSLENNKALDFCSLGKSLQKPPSWVIGHLMLYLLRPADDIKVMLNSELSSALKLLKTVATKKSEGEEAESSSYKCLTATIYLRRGKMDWNRQSVDGSQHLAVLQQMNKEMHGTGEQICSIYIASNDPNGTIFRNASIAPNQMVSIHGFQVLSLSRFLGDTSQGLEMEYQLPLFKMNPDFKPEQMYVEYLVDLWLMVEADVFVGAWSNNMVLASMLRAAVHPERWQNRTCMLDTTAKPPKKFDKWCLGMPQLQKHFYVPGPQFADGSIYTTEY